MFLKAQLQWNVTLPAKNLNAKGLELKKAIIIRLMDEFAAKKATNNLGDFLAVTTLDKVGEGRIRQQTGDVLFPVTFTCITFKIFVGEILEGEAHKILKHGVFLRCGPVEDIYLTYQKMQGYTFVPGENPFFMSEQTAKIEKGVRVRVKVVGVKYMEAERKFQAVVEINGDYLGPVE